MKKYLIAAAGLTAFAAAAPATAQHYGYGQPQGYGYGQPQGYGYGYNNRDQHGLIRSYIVRADRLRQRIERLDSRDRISEREARRLREDAAQLQRRVREHARNGLSFNERRDLDIRLARLEQRIQFERHDGRQNGRAYHGGDRWVDRNRNGIDDRQEDLYRSDRDRDGVYDGRDGWIDRNRNGIDDRYEQRRWDRDDD